MTETAFEKFDARRDGFYMPAEWAVQESVILSWPLNPVTWPDRKAQAEKAYAKFAAEISKREMVRTLCVKAEQPRVSELLSGAGAHMCNIVFMDIRTNDAWCRDHGPIFLKSRKDSSRIIIDYIYNAWGGKFEPWDADDAVPSKISEMLEIPRVRVSYICEGGALEVNGEGDLLTTESVLLNDNRNPSVPKSEAEKILRRTLGVERVHWLKSGMVGDDTDGHIDTLARFFRKDAVLAIVEDSKSARHYDVLMSNFKALEKMKVCGGEKLNVIPLNCPAPIVPENWREEVLPATYANFLIVNGAVLVPTYRQDASDSKALDIIGSAFPEYEIVPVDCYDIILEGGALHCLSQQQPL